MRIVDYTKIALKDLCGQKIRSSLTLFALIISTVILVLMAAISIGGRQAIANQFGTDSALTGIIVTPNQSGSSLNPYGTVQEVNSAASKLDDTVVTQLARLSHVQSATPRSHVWEFNHFSLEGSSKQFVAQAEGIAVDAHVPLSAGASFTSNDDTNSVIIGFGYAKELGFEANPGTLVGKTLTIVTQKGYRGIKAKIPGATASATENEAFNKSETTLRATIVGVTANGQDQNNIYIPLGWAHAVRTARYQEGAILKTVDQIAQDGYSSLQLRVDGTANVKEVSDTITKLGYGQVSTLAQIERLQQFTTLMWAILGTVAFIAVVAAALGVVNTMLMAVSEQRHTIGVWRACGARRGFIVNLFLIEAGLLGCIGGVIGVGIGFVLSHFVNEYITTLLKSQGLVLTDVAIIPWWLMVGTILLTTLFGILAGSYPAYGAARQDPSQTLSSGQ
jgi:ABC-type antimicrobial peptide transport system permease subunit